MLQPPHVRARQRFIRRYAGPIAAGLIIGGGLFAFWPSPAERAQPAGLAAHAVEAPFANCAAARAAGAAPVRRGEPGYGCEPLRF